MANTDTDKALAEFLARGGTITQCGSTMKQARSLRSMRRDEERRLTDQVDTEVAEREQIVRERLAEIFG